MRSVAGLPPELSPRTVPRSSRGLTGPGVITLALVIALIGAFVDGLSGTPNVVGAACAVCFVLASCAPPALARPDALRTAAVMPPLIFAAMAVVASALQVSGQSLLHGTIYGFVQALATSPGAPIMFVGTGLCGAIVIARKTRVIAARRPVGTGKG